jgi:hypothetical protein
MARAGHAKILHHLKLRRIDRETDRGGDPALILRLNPEGERDQQSKHGKYSLDYWHQDVTSPDPRFVIQCIKIL